MAVCEEASSSSSKPPPGCLVLRVKRKREEDPAEALIVAKQSKLETGTSVFHFFGTLREEHGDGVILDRLQHYRDRSSCLKSNPFSRLSLEDSRSQNRESAKAKSSTQRFRVLSHLRCLQEVRESSVVAGERERGEESSATDGSRSSGGTVHICDAIQEDHTQPTATVGAVTCNDTVMLRQKVEHNTHGHVYDLYCTRESDTLNMESATFDWSSLSVYGSELVHDIFDDHEEVYEDEDDSNDEDNWRNDYPDEEGSATSLDSDLDNCGEYRHRHALYSGSDDEYGLENCF